MTKRKSTKSKSQRRNPMRIDKVKTPLDRINKPLIKKVKTPLNRIKTLM